MNFHLDSSLDVEAATALGAVIRAVYPEDFGVDEAAWLRALLAVTVRLPKTEIPPEPLERILGLRVAVGRSFVPQRGIVQHRIVRSIFDVWRHEKERVREALRRSPGQRHSAGYRNAVGRFAHPGGWDDRG